MVVICDQMYISKGRGFFQQEARLYGVAGRRLHRRQHMFPFWISLRGPIVRHREHAQRKVERRTTINAHGGAEGSKGKGEDETLPTGESRSWYEQWDRPTAFPRVTDRSAMAVCGGGSIVELPDWQWWSRNKGPFPRGLCLEFSDTQDGESNTNIKKSVVVRKERKDAGWDQCMEETKQEEVVVTLQTK